MTDQRYELLFSLSPLDNENCAFTIEARQAPDGQWHGVVCCRGKVDKTMSVAGQPFMAYPPFMVARTPQEIAAAWKAFPPERRKEILVCLVGGTLSERKAARRQAVGCMAMFVGAQALFVALMYSAMSGPHGRIVPVLYLLLRPIGATGVALITAAICVVFDVLAWVIVPYFEDRKHGRQKRPQ